MEYDLGFQLQNSWGGEWGVGFRETEGEGGQVGRQMVLDVRNGLWTDTKHKQ